MVDVLRMRNWTDCFFLGNQFCPSSSFHFSFHSVEDRQQGNVFRSSLICAIATGLGIFFFYRFFLQGLPAMLWIAPLGMVLNGFVWLIFPVVTLIILITILVGTATCAILSLVLLFGLFRGLVLFSAGATDREFPRNLVKRLMYDEFSIAAFPIGKMPIVLVAGNRLINHTAIYDDLETIEIVTSEIKRYIS